MVLINLSLRQKTFHIGFEQYIHCYDSIVILTIINQDHNLIRFKNFI